MSRFQVIQGNPPNLPHQCAVCGSINGSFIDFGLDLEFYGTVYLCLENCILQLANELGYSSPAQHALSVEMNKLLQKKSDELLAENEALRNALGIISVHSNHPISIDDDFPTEPAGNESNVSNPEPKQEPAGPSTEQRSHDIRNDDGFNKFFLDI